MIRPALIGAVALCALACATSAKAASVHAANPTRNSLDWAAAVAAQGGSITTAIDLLGRDGAALDPLADLCERGVVVESGASHVVRATPGAESGSMLEPRSAGEGLMDVAEAIVFQDSGAWTITISFRVPVLAAGIMSADLFNPGGDNPLVLRAFNGPGGSGDMLAEATSPAFNFQLNRLCFLGIVDASSRIRSITVSTPGIYPDEVFITEVLMAVEEGWNASAAPDADVNLDGVVDGFDLELVSAAFGSTCRGFDIDGDGVVDTDDRLAVVETLGDSTIPARTNRGPVVGGEVLPPTTGGGPPNGSPRGSGSTHPAGGGPAGGGPAGGGPAGGGQAPGNGEPTIAPIGSSSNATGPSELPLSPTVSEELPARSIDASAEIDPVIASLAASAESNPQDASLAPSSATTLTAPVAAPAASVGSVGSVGSGNASLPPTPSTWLPRGLRLLLGASSMMR